MFFINLHTIPHTDKAKTGLKTGKEAGCGGPGLAWLHMVCCCEACSAKCSKMTLEAAYGREMNIKFPGNSSGGHSCRQHANSMLPTNLRHLWHCVV